MQPIHLRHRVMGGGDSLDRIVTERELRHRWPDIEDMMLAHDDSPAHCLSDCLRELADVKSWASDWDSNDSGTYIADRWATLNEAAADLLA